jgi:uncharacterized caspase-like protein
MAHRAIVAGVDNYTGQASLNLHGAVDDALSMAGWLADPQGGAVPAANIVLMTSPAVASLPAPLSGVTLNPGATAQAINVQIDEIVTKAARPADRLYFYFSGHGLTAPTDIAEEAILPSDFSAANLTVALGVRSILERLKTAQFNHQFVFIDACRNILFPRRFRPGALLPDFAEQRPQVQQFVYMATSRGLTSAEAGTIGSSRAGVFTGALLKGLRGDGEAKVYNAATRMYDVTSSRLLQYLVNQVRRQIEALPDAARNAGFVQTPTLSGERIDDPKIVSIPRDKVAPVTLELTITPESACSSATLVVDRDDVPVAEVPPPLRVPCTVSLPPKEYRVSATSAVFAAEPSVVGLELYRDDSVSFIMTAMAAEQAAGAGGALAVETTRGFIPSEADTGGAAAPAPAPMSPFAVLTVTSPDPASPLEIEHAGNERTGTPRAIVVSGRHSIQATVDPGFYVARLRAPNGRSVEQAVALSAGERQTVPLEPPAASGSPRLAELSRAAGFTRTAGTLEVSRGAGMTSAAWARLSTVLSAAATAQLFPSDSPEAARVRSLGLSALRSAMEAGAGSAIQLLSGDEYVSSAGSGEDYTASLRLACWPLDHTPAAAEEAPRRLPGFAFIAEHCWALSPGCYWVALRDADSRVLVPVTVYPERVTNFICTRNERRKVSVFVSAPAGWGPPAEVMQSERSLEMAQRYLMTGLVSDASLVAGADEPDPDRLLRDKWTDPVAGLLGAYLMLRGAESDPDIGSRRFTTLQRAAQNLAASFGASPDSYVLAAEMRLRAGQDESAKAAVRQALNLGIPVFDEGLLRLLRLVRNLNIAHPRAALLDRIVRRRIPGMIWTVCSPEGDTP